MHTLRPASLELMKSRDCHWLGAVATRATRPRTAAGETLSAESVVSSPSNIKRAFIQPVIWLREAAWSSYWGRYIRRPMISRLERDRDLGSALHDDMMRHPTPWKKSAYPHAIARTQGLAPSAREWVTEEYGRQKSLLTQSSAMTLSMESCVL
jgi:hypothetical protein